ncbi:PQQ-dependent sugar dehydrogenase [Desertivirga xinjiangensis]|uniref:PQQ-dependent sugar dehydrogenase n=1 Tax=Desertivirga xinjiangensis TaxID=539206 RepID=UPI00210A66D5|nr:PQQ-dependent sugar dehydrogenase [Pedobacter xinjiangensis]
MKTLLTRIFGVTLLLAGLIYGCKKGDGFWDTIVPETEEETTSAQINGYVFRPALVQATDANIAQLKVPAGFKVAKFADQLGKPRILLAGNNGVVYASDREAGLVTMLKDNNNDGLAEVRQIVATIKQAHGLAIYNNQMYITSVREVYRSNINPDGTLTQPQMIINNLPDGGQHPNRTLAFGPDGMLYITVGSTCNACDEPNGKNATILRANADGSNISVYAKGLRNTIGFGWHPQTGELWGMDHGIDWLGDNEQKEELNLIKHNGNYGWPYIYGDGKYNPGTNPPPGDTTYQQYLQMTTLPSLLYDAHAAPMQMVFYTKNLFPSEYVNDAFVTMRGSWNRSQPVGYKVVRLRFENGQPVRFEDFLTGFLVNNNRAHFARPVGLTVHSDGSLLVGDDTNGVIYRISRQ